MAPAQDEAAGQDSAAELPLALLQPEAILRVQAQAKEENSQPSSTALRPNSRVMLGPATESVALSPVLSASTMVISPSTMKRLLPDGCNTVGEARIAALSAVSRGAAKTNSFDYDECSTRRIVPALVR